MLNGTSKAGITEILSFLDDNTVLSLATTVTQGLLKNRLNTREEAVNAVVNYSSDALSVLRRKIITKEILLSYLYKKNVSVDLPASKIDLVQKTADFWSIQYTHESTNTYSNTVDSGSINQLAEQFAQWFYTMLNKNECMNHEHFYPDAKIQITMVNSGQATTEVIEGDPLQIVQRLLLLRMNFNLVFNPNLSAGGVQGRVDPHGLVLVLVCGTLHAQGACVGIFEQVFGLVRDPQVSNNWKIKMSEINLKSQTGVTGLPTLESTNLLRLTS
ncbi:uncharacterized protein C3orf38 homolog [Zophobas morio]|uniref:uncharacterized protein C3orf38 homolog n=1 Tax=Zophobas morio TaxID=2755281 RepID=UPI003082EA65